MSRECLKWCIMRLDEEEQEILMVIMGLTGNRTLEVWISLKSCERAGEPEIVGHIVGLQWEVSELVQYQVMSSSRMGPWHAGRRGEKIKIIWAQEARNFCGWGVGWPIHMNVEIFPDDYTQSGEEAMSQVPKSSANEVVWPEARQWQFRERKSGVGWWFLLRFRWDMQEKEKPLLERCRGIESRHLTNTRGMIKVRQALEMALSWGIRAPWQLNEGFKGHLEKSLLGGQQWSSYTVTKGW